MPFVRTGGMTQTRVEEDKGVEVGIVGVECLGVVQSVEVFDVGGDLELVADAVFDNGTERILRRARRERVFIITVGHALRADEDQVEGGTREEPGQLLPNLTRQ